MKTEVDIIEIYQRLLGKIIKAMQDSNFALCTALSSEMIRVFDYLDFTDGIFIGEFLESLFMNIDFLNTKYIIEDTDINNLKNDLNNLIMVLKNSFPLNNAKKIKIYNLISDSRAKVTKLQLESFRGERKRKPEQKAPRIKLPTPDEIIEIG